MKTTRLKCLLVLIVLAIIEIGPVSVTSLIGMAVVIFRPAWFLRLTRNLYADINTSSLIPGKHPTLTRCKGFLSLLVLLILDIAPIPVASAIGLLILLTRPLWFYRMVETIYA